MPDGSDLAVDDAIEACVAGWSDAHARAAAATRLGLAIDDALAGALTRRLAVHNGKRRRYTLPLAEVVRAICEAAAAGLAVRHGGKGTPRDTTPTTIVFAARSTDHARVVVDIRACPARSASPGSAWRELAPWRPLAERNDRKAQEWAASTRGKLIVPLAGAPDAGQTAAAATSHALLAEVLARPADDEPRLVYADALTQRGDPRGEFIVLQCTPGDDPKRQQRERSLLRKHGAAWMRDVKQVARACMMRRGFVASVSMARRARPDGDGSTMTSSSIGSFANRSAACCTNCDGVTQPLLARLLRIVAAGRTWIGDGGDWRAVQQFFQSPHLRTRDVTMELAGWDFRLDVDGLFDATAFPHVRVA